MTETTQQADTTAADVRQILTTLADQLAAGPHYRIITQAGQLAAILDTVTAQHGYGLAALNLDLAVRARVPLIDWDITCGEYALIIRAAAGGAR